MGNYYVDNIPTYCTRKVEDPGYGKVDGGRTSYKLEGVGGNLEGKTVGDDCSSFVFACLYQQGFIQDYRSVANVPNTKGYLPNEWFGTILSESGFVWISRDELTADDLQPGDILLRRNEEKNSGHVEIFDHFDENGMEYAYSWGEIYAVEPTIKHCTNTGIFKTYLGVWRYVGKE